MLGAMGDHYAAGVDTQYQHRYSSRPGRWPPCRLVGFKTHHHVYQRLVIGMGMMGEYLVPAPPYVIESWPTTSHVTKAQWFLIQASL